MEWLEIMKEEYWNALEAQTPAVVSGYGFLSQEVDSGPCSVTGGQNRPRYSAYICIDGVAAKCSRPLTVVEFGRVERSSVASSLRAQRQRLLVTRLLQ